MREPAGRCPVCRARFRSERACLRCGADLGPLMELAVRAFLLRRAAQEALSAGNFEAASELAASAQRTCFTARGERLRLVTLALSGRTRF